MTTLTLVHVSDFHFGWPFIPEVGDALVKAAHEQKPAAVVIIALATP